MNRPAAFRAQASDFAFIHFGALGVVLATGLGSFLALSRGGDPWLPPILAGSGVLIIVGLGPLLRRTLGKRGLTFYHHALVFLVLVAATPGITGTPLLPTLDLAAFMLAVSQGVGRLGCLFAGCCHGKPHAWGVRYGYGRVANGFRRYMIDLPLFPVQGVEAVLSSVMALILATVLLDGQPAGAALASWGLLYGTLRFFTEELRGDPDRPYLGSLSEGQWTSMILVGGVLLLEMGGVLPTLRWHAALILLAAPTALIWLWMQGKSRVLLRARHLDELARIAFLWTGGWNGGTPDTRTGMRGPHRTREGIVLSFEPFPAPAENLVAFSSAASELDRRSTKRLADTLGVLFHMKGAGLQRGGNATFFLASSPPPISPSVPRPRRSHAV